MAILSAPFKANASPSRKMRRRIDMSCVNTIILGGGTGTRLYPLTLTRCKPAICFAGRYRLIDIPMSNALNSGCHKIYILTQFLSASLHQHILKTYRLESHNNGFIEILSAEQKPSKQNWYQGTADAIRQNVEYLTDGDADYFLILSGDQLYQMDFEEMVALAEETDADVVIAGLPADEASAKRLGIFKIDSDQRITHFVEKPQKKEELDLLRSSSNDKPYLGSMGIYLFKRKILLDILREDPREDFGKHLIPSLVGRGNTVAYVYPGYWEDIGTIESFYHANINLTSDQPLFNLMNGKFPIHTELHTLFPSKIHNTRLTSSLICEGSQIHAASISHSIIGPRSIIGKECVIDRSYLLGNDDYQASIGEGCEIRGAIIDKQAKIGKKVKLINRDGLDSYESDNIYIRDGIMIVARSAVIPDNFIL
jgi:glucose-1-phosphate adenylyltransferase